MNNEEEKRCPLCAEEMDWTDQQLNPCKCGYEVCVWCWHHLMDMAEKDATEGRCPACGTPYDKDKIVGLEENFERKDLSNVRLLQQKDYFGQYGKVTKVSLSRTVGGSVQHFINDTCSVYITYSKEEEAVICIQSVHGYVLDGRLLRASFGTAKYCHAWLRNTPCNNPACLYLHTVGAEEDSFSKDEVAAVHTRSRVEEIVGGTRYLHRCSGSMLPPPVIEQLNILSDSSLEPVCNNGLKEVGYRAVGSSDHFSCSKEPSRLSNNTTTFVDIVGRSSRSGSNKDVNSVERADSNHDDTTKEQSTLILLDSPTFDDQRLKDSVGSTHTDSLFSSYPVKSSKNGSDQSWWDSEYHNQISADCNIRSYADEHDAMPSSYMSSVTNDGYNEKKFGSCAKSDRIYRCSNSFSNEEIVEHLRRIDHDTMVNDDENFADVESSIISGILSMDLDGSDSSAFPQKAAGLFEGRNGRHGSLHTFQNINQSRFSFANEHGQPNELSSTSSGIGQELNFSDNEDNLYRSQHHGFRAQNLTPPGFPMPSKPASGFFSCIRTKQEVISGLYQTLIIVCHRWGI